MGLKERIAILWAKRNLKRISRTNKQAIQNQHRIFNQLLIKGKKTKFGKDHNFGEIRSYSEYKSSVPIKDYEGLKEYFDRVLDQEKDVLWPGYPKYLCKTSGTTSGTKYIPITKDSMPSHINGARNALLTYIARTGQADFLKGKMMQIQGNPTLEEKGKLKIGRLSGIVAHYVPNYLLKNRLPSMQTNSINDWEEKMDRIVNETSDQNMTLIAGIPIWVQNYFEKSLEKTGKHSIGELFPNLQLLVFGGVNLNPYKNTFKKLIGKDIDTLEIYPASEGYIAYQDTMDEEGLLLITDQGIFYEFIRTDEYFNENPERISLKDVEVGINYALIINSNAGLWAYSIGDTVKFVSLQPFRILVTGRIQHFISAFGEHVISEEVDAAMKFGIDQTGCSIRDFTLAPQFNPESASLPFHEWFVEFIEEPEDMEVLSTLIDQKLQEKNEYYRNFIEGDFLQQLKIRKVRKDGFNDFMKKRGKLGGQNKVPRLSNDRKIADELVEFVIY